MRNKSSCRVDLFTWKLWTRYVISYRSFCSVEVSHRGCYVNSTEAFTRHRCDFSYVNTPFYFPGISDEILMHDHGYACSLMTNSLANISLNREQLLSDTDALSAEIRSLNVQLDELKVEFNLLGQRLYVVDVFLWKK